jgi:hypothetical protein
MKKLNVQIRLKMREVAGPDLPQVSTRFMVAAHHQVLPIIHRIAGVFVGKGIGPAAEVGFLFKKEDFPTS